MLLTILVFCLVGTGLSVVSLASAKVTYDEIMLLRAQIAELKETGVIVEPPLDTTDAWGNP